MSKPEGCIYPDCLNCILDDCYYDIESEQADVMLEIGELEVFCDNLKKTSRTPVRDNEMYRKAMNRKYYLLRKLYDGGISYEER